MAEGRDSTGSGQTTFDGQAESGRCECGRSGCRVTGNSKENRAALCVRAEFDLMDDDRMADTLTGCYSVAEDEAGAT